MTNEEKILEGADLEMIAKQGTKIYESIKDDYGPDDRGKFLAIDIHTTKVYLGSSSAEAVEAARQKHPNTIFFVVKIGYSATEMLANMGLYAERVH